MYQTLADCGTACSSAISFPAPRSDFPFLNRESIVSHTPDSEVVDIDELTPTFERDRTLQDPERVEVVDSKELTPNEERALLDPQSVEVADTEELTPDEERDRLHLERKIEKAFYEAGKALQQLRDRKLYRSSHRTFEEYCRDRFGFSRRQPYYLIEAAAGER